MSKNRKIKINIRSGAMLIPLIAMFSLLLGCSYTLHKTKKDEANPADTGTKTELQFKGPKAVLQHKF